MIKRILEAKIRKRIGSNKAIVLLGARQTGKTTLLKTIFEDKPDVLWLNGDSPETRLTFEDITIKRLKKIIGRNKFVIIDEAQRIKDIGIKMKLIIDQFPNIQLVTSGSSSFELANEINEPLTGRKWAYKLYPISYKELLDHYGYYYEKLELENRLIFGSYPEVVTADEDKIEILNTLASDYLYKDILVWNKIKKADKILKLLQALAFQVGSQVSYKEIGKTIGLDNQTVESYIDLLEKAFVIFRLPSFSRNVRNELKKSKKIYFYDNGIRNAIIANFNSLSLRNDIGALWENFLISERIKHTAYNNIYCNKYFWRTTAQKEIDYIEERDGKLYAFEFKWNNMRKTKLPKTFLNAYPDSKTQVIHQDNFEAFLGDE